MRFARDEELVRLVRAGDESAFEAIYDRHARGVLSFCRHMLGSREEAEDAVQHTFASAFRDLARSSKSIQLKAWLYTIARNRSLSILRARREERALDDVAEPSVEGLSSQVQRRQDLRDMLADLQALPDDQRAALVLAELGALSHEEIAMTLDVRKDKVKALVFQARESLANSRQAREADCAEIQEQLAVLRGGALRRTELRRHVAVCPACAAYKGEVQRQRAAMAIILPVAPTIGLKQTAITAAIAAGSGSAALGGGSAAGGGLLGAIGAKGLAAKVMAIATVAGTATGGGLMVVDELNTAPADDRRASLAVAPGDDRAVTLVEDLRERASRVGDQRSRDRLTAAATERPQRPQRPASTRSERRAGPREASKRGGDRARPAPPAPAGPPVVAPAFAGAEGEPSGRGRDKARKPRPERGRGARGGVPGLAKRSDEGPDKGKKPRKAKKNEKGGPPSQRSRHGAVGTSPAEPPGQARKAPEEAVAPELPDVPAQLKDKQDKIKDGDLEPSTAVGVVTGVFAPLRGLLRGA